jgi:hypothetical protein
MVMKVTPGSDAEDAEDQDDVTDYALARWDRTLRLCAIRLSGSLPAFASPLVWWLVVRR